jgi:hypothetical protein
MKFTLLPHFHEGKSFYISPLTGNLVVNENKISPTGFNQNLVHALELCDNPYLLKSLKNIPRYETNYNLISELSVFNKRLMFLNNKRFFFSCLYSSFQNSLYENTIDAFDNIENLEIHKINKGQLCLQRALLAAKTSKSFKNNGVLFIGATLPTRNMHAWIIEDYFQPDREDRMWIMYKPLLAIQF